MRTTAEHVFKQQDGEYKFRLSLLKNRSIGNKIGKYSHSVR